MTGQEGGAQNDKIGEAGFGMTRTGIGAENGEIGNGGLRITKEDGWPYPVSGFRWSESWGQASPANPEQWPIPERNLLVRLLHSLPLQSSPWTGESVVERMQYG